MDNQTKSIVFSWFSSSLRNGQSNLAHFTNQLQGMGEYLKTKSRYEFFKVIAGIVNHLKTTQDRRTICTLIDSCFWQIKANDHQFLVRTGILDVLLKGNSKAKPEDNPIKFGWGIGVNLKNSVSEIVSISESLFELLQHLGVSCFGRLLLDKSTHLQLNDSKSKEGPAIQKAFSTVNTEVAEVLLAKIGETIFRQISSY